MIITYTATFILNYSRDDCPAMFVKVGHQMCTSCFKDDLMSSSAPFSKVHEL